MVELGRCIAASGRKRDAKRLVILTVAKSASSRVG
jgi:hypothetical protein